MIHGSGYSLVSRGLYGQPISASVLPAPSRLEKESWTYRANDLRSTKPTTIVANHSPDII